MKSYEFHKTVLVKIYTLRSESLNRRISPIKYCCMFMNQYRKKLPSFVSIALHENVTEVPRSPFRTPKCPYLEKDFTEWNLQYWSHICPRSPLPSPRCAPVIKLGIDSLKVSNSITEGLKINYGTLFKESQVIIMWAARYPCN